MKIIGEGKDSFVCVMSKDEAANYAGEYSAYNFREQWHEGTTLKMGDIYSKAAEAINDFEVIKKSVNELHNAAVRIITKMDLKKDGK